MIANTVFIYTLADPRTGEVRYVGKTVDLVQRLFSHLSERRWNKKNHWMIGLNKLGMKPVLEVLEEINSENDFDWQESERFWIETLKFYGVRLLNLDSGGRGNRRLSQETKDKIGLANGGKVRTNEVREKIRAANLSSEKSKLWLEKFKKIRIGKKHSAETKLKISLAHKGLKKTKSQCDKMRLARLGDMTVSNIRAAMTPDQLSSMRAKMRLGWERRRMTPVSETTKKRMSIAHKRRSECKKLACV